MQSRLDQIQIQDLVDSLAKAGQRSEYNKEETSSFKNYFKRAPKRRKRGRPRNKKHWQTSQKEKRTEEAKKNQTMIDGVLELTVATKATSTR